MKKVINKIIATMMTNSLQKREERKKSVNGKKADDIKNENDTHKLKQY